MIGKAQGECDDGERRIRVAYGRKDRAARHVEILDAIDTALSINHTVRWVAMHAGGAHLVFAGLDGSEPSGRFLAERHFQPAQSSIAQGGVEELVSAFDAPDVDIV